MERFLYKREKGIIVCQGQISYDHTLEDDEWIYCPALDQWWNIDGECECPLKFNRNCI